MTPLESTTPDSSYPFSSLTQAVLPLLGPSVTGAAGDELRAVLGLSFRMIAVPAACPAHWSDFAEDVQLESAAALFGFRVRPLHPRSAAIGLDDCAAYRQHFLASYVPLIQTALAHGQPVLAWRGWPGDGSHHWGIITAAGVDGSPLTGTTPSAPGCAVPLINPPHQCYIVEQFSPRTLRPNELLSAVAAILRRSPGPEATDRPIRVGPDAWFEWTRFIVDRVRCPVHGPRSFRCHARHARALVAARESIARFLRGQSSAAPPDSLLELLAAVDAFDRTAAILRPIAGETRFPATGPHHQSSQWRTAIQSARDADADAIHALRRALALIGN